MSAFVEPLDSAVWFARIEKVANGELGGMEQALRHASHLLQLTPIPFRHVIHLAIGEDRFEALLASGDLDAAARHLIAQPAALIIEGDGKADRVRATISCTILGRAIEGAGDTIAEAVLSAWTTCLLALKTEYGANLRSGPRQISA